MRVQNLIDKYPNDYHMFIVVKGRQTGDMEFPDVVYMSDWAINYRYTDMGPKLRLFICRKGGK